MAPEEDGIAQLPAQIHVQGDQELLGGAAQLWNSDNYLRMDYPGLKV